MLVVFFFGWLVFDPEGAFICAACVEILERFLLFICTSAWNIERIIIWGLNLAISALTTCRYLKDNILFEHCFEGESVLSVVPQFDGFAVWTSYFSKHNLSLINFIIPVATCEVQDIKQHFNSLTAITV